MHFSTLLQLSKHHLQNHPEVVSNVFSFDLFTQGAHWMAHRLNELDDSKIAVVDPMVNFKVYGFGKYILCVLFFVISLLFSLKLNLLLMPVSILVFYFVEVQLLFLFPLLIDQVERPILTSIRLTSEIGVFRAVITVIPIAFYMAWGLCNVKKPFKNWYIGCLAVVIWYQYEVRNRL